MTDSMICSRLSELTDRKDEWPENIPFVASLLQGRSVRVTAKALWLLGEMGLRHPNEIRDCVPCIASFLTSSEPLLRQRSLNALGRAGRGCFSCVQPFLGDMAELASDSDPGVRLSFIWASENIASVSPDAYGVYMQVFSDLLSDAEVRVRMEAPEIFRVIGKSRPDLVFPFAEQLADLAENDPDRVVRIHSAGALKNII
ncbi:MAG: HEAT repeat domain-containing protein [Oscillospiraceae bacterium]|nr:HEAT repeat domain-containing protein [Oscillospiraceae bacterium]